MPSIAAYNQSGRRRRWALRLALIVVLVIAGARWRAGGSSASSTDRSGSDDVAAVASEADGADKSATSRAGRSPILPVIETGELRLEGQAVDTNDHPIGGVKVTLGGKRTTLTEADGSFGFDDLAAGSYQLIAEKDDLYGEELDATLDPTSDPISLKMVRGPSIVVHVLDSAAAPIAGAKVESSSRAAFTDADGNARLRGLELGSEQIQASAPGHAQAQKRVSTGDDPAQTFEVTLVLASGADVAGIVIDEDGKPIDDAFVELEAINGTRTEIQGADESGAWRIALLGAGTYLARVHSTKFLGAADVRIELDGVHPKTGIVLNVVRGGSISGIVVDTSGAPVADADVQISGKHPTTDATGAFTATGLAPDNYEIGATTKTAGSPMQTVALARGQRLHVRLVVQVTAIAGIVVDTHGNPIEGAQVYARSDAAHGNASDRTDEHGRFDVGGVPPGDYDLEANRDDETAHAKPVPIHVKAGTRSVRIVLPDLATIAGRVVLDGQPVAYYGFTVTDDLTVARYGTPTPVRDPHGAFSVRGVEPGSWNVVIVGPGFARKTIEHIAVADGATVDLGDIVVDRGLVLRGHVTDTRGAPVAGAVVRVSRGMLRADEDDRLGALIRDNLTATTDGNGAYELAGMTASEDTRRIIASHGTSSSVARTLTPEDTEVDLVIAATGGIDGTVINTVPGEVYFVWATSVTDAAVSTNADLDPSGAFRFDQLPPGDYVLRLGMRRAVPEIAVTVVADARATATFQLPHDPVKLIVNVSAHCELVGLRPTGTEAMYATELCGDNQQVEFDPLTPGSYDLCLELENCRSFVVPPQPVVTISL